MTDVIIAHWWHILAVLIAPLAGFMVAQYYKAQQEVKPSAGRIALVAGGITAILAAWLWNGSLDERAKIGVLIGIVQPIIVWCWFKAAHKFAPEQAKSLGGSNGDLTLLPWVKVKKKHTESSEREDGAPKDYADDATEPRSVQDSD